MLPMLFMLKSVELLVQDVRRAVLDGGEDATEVEWVEVLNASPRRHGLLRLQRAQEIWPAPPVIS
jgi:hypothetical protein